MFVAIGASFAESSLTSCATYLASYSMARGNTENVAYTMITASNAVGILGRYVPGYFADRIHGRFNVEIITIQWPLYSILSCGYRSEVTLRFCGHSSASGDFRQVPSYH